MDSVNNLKKPSKKQADLTIEDLKSYPGLEHLTDQQASHIVSSLKELSILLYYYYNDTKSKRLVVIDNQPIIRILKRNNKAA